MRFLARVRSIARIPIFVVAAGLGRLFVRENLIDWTSIKTDLRHLSPPNLQIATSRGLVTYHPWYQGFKGAAVRRCLKEAASLGTTILRSDVRWGDVMPDAKNFNEDALTWYVDYFKAVHDDYGMVPMIVLSNPPKRIHGLTLNELNTAWKMYVHQVVDRFGHVCQSYQVLNELNNPVYEIFPSGEIASVVTSTAKIIHGQIPKAKVIVNFLAGVFSWREDAERFLRECISDIDVLGLDYYPGTWAFANSDDWVEIEDFIRDINSTFQDKIPYILELAILETGYASNIPHLRGSLKQAIYFRDWKKVVPKLERVCRSGKLAYIGVYELCDARSSAWLNPEAHFGLLDSRTLYRKAAFDEVKQLFTSLI
jgi:hypothetical protein